MSTVALTGPETSTGLSAYVARPSTRGPWPGVVVIHEAWGLDDVVRRQADHLASLGYLAIAPDLFSDGGGLRCIRGVMAAMTKQQGRAFADIEAARRWLLDSEDCTGKVGVIGFCMGGGFALVLAGRGEYAVAAPNYGMLPKDLAVLKGACPIVASYGGKDAGFKGAAQQLAQALADHGAPHDVREYAEAGHSFLNDASNGPLPTALMRIAHVGPHPESAAHAWGRIDTFFSRYLATKS
ncbi:carboxymethylenebutenolidase [Enemella dayhoffiae]|uniref:Carboxymethylenebutenolidase n=1 Tax=Enemella dayhoffiae TaxID=2016507 RepID=A0A255H5Z5_9ACTN|nr:dienelactone hydrolase family protein [Enemella dayhoffiae]OYO23075.1 carboxymethylenebutenolidase [Enemella dayhoffiae]